MSRFFEYFSGRIEEFIANYSGRTLIFFKGFAIEQVQQLISHPNSILNDLSLFQMGHLDLELLEDRWLDIASSINNATEPLIGFYEELLTIRQIIPRIKVEKIIIVENNILSPWTPCFLSYDCAEMFFDYGQTEKEAPAGSLLSRLVQMYGDVKLLKTRRALFLPVALDDERIEAVPFWQDTETKREIFSGDIEHIEIGSARDWEYCLDLTEGLFKPAILLQNENNLPMRIGAVLSVAQLFGFDVFIDEVNLYQKKTEYEDSHFVHILQKYWGETASFRSLLFYKDPDSSRQTETITQGQIISEIVNQCEAAQNGDVFSNVFITAPTGAGKSILFQIPALYLAEKYNLVTIVVSPLIALMNDQVDQLQRERGISIAACINSSMSIEKRSHVIEQIHLGQKSLLYLAPELLLTTHLQSFLGGRQVGMVVIDEAHIVTSWGRDFRTDYWFLGDFLKQTSRDGLIFPVLCLTATAVYSGEEDVVNDIIHELGLEKTIVHLGNVKRDNISFDIQRYNPSSFNRKVEDVKFDLTIKRMKEYICKCEKVLTYFPYRSQVDQIYNMQEVKDHARIRRYHGQVPFNERKRIEFDYKVGTAMGLYCTKAFGMGVDVGDIKHVIHFAPTGTLSDYVQEIGRLARDPDIQGIAHIDYFPSDLRYVRSLNGISEMRQYQLREMLKKICMIQKTKKRRNLLISAETFEYLFREKEVANRTKLGLMLLSKDLGNKYSFPVLIVRPKAMLSKNYVNVPSEIESEFLRLYGSYCKYEQDVVSRIVPSKNQSRASDMTVYSLGRTFLVNMAKIWENFYGDRSFGMFKKEFFEKKYFANDQIYTISPRVRVEIRYSDDFAVVSSRLLCFVNAVAQIFGRYKNADVKQFTQRQFEMNLIEILGEKIVPHDKIGMLLDIFTENVDDNAVYSKGRNHVRVLRYRKQNHVDETCYFVSNSIYTRLPNYFSRQIQQCSVNMANNSFFRFYPLVKNQKIEIMPLLRLLELLGLGSYEIRGGEKSEVFIRINDPIKLERLAMSGKYNNGVLQSIKERHRYNERLLAAFFATDMCDEKRWKLIEQYFLGNEEYVKRALNLSD